MRSLSLILAACLGIAAWAPAPLSLKPREALLIIELEPTRRLKSDKIYQVWLTAFSVRDGVVTTDASGRWAAIMNSRPGQGERQFVVAKAHYRSYVLRTLMVSAWGACFNGGTYQFDVAPGEAIFVGRVSPDTALDDLFQAVADKKLPAQVMSNRGAQYLVDTPRPALAGPDDLPGWEARVADFLAREHPSLKARLVPARLSPITFKAGGNGGRSSCGDARFARGEEKLPAP